MQSEIKIVKFETELYPCLLSSLNDDFNAIVAGTTSREPLMEDTHSWDNIKQGAVAQWEHSCLARDPDDGCWLYGVCRFSP